eukprot:gene24589-30955_t
MLKRFELVPPTRTKPAFYVDNLKSHKWTRVPGLLRNEPPGSPRTMDRRIAAETKKKDMRMKRFQVALNKCNTHDIFAREFNSVKLLKQFVIFRDLVALAMYRLNKSMNNNFTGTNSLASASNMKGISNSNNFPTPLINTNITFNGSFLLDTGPQYTPVWVCMSAPASTARQLGLSMALAVMSPIAARNNVKTPPMIGSPSISGEFSFPPAASSSPATPSGGRKHLAPSKDGDKKDGKRVSSVVSVNYNKALQALESRAWDCLKCSTPEEVLSALMFTDILPSVESVMHISQDEHNIWHGGLDFVKQDNVTLNNNNNQSNGRAPPPVFPSDNNNNNNTVVPPAPVVNIDPTLYRNEVLPMCMQLRPCQVSPWAFYPEVMKCRDPIIASLKNYANLPSTKTLVKSYHTQAANAYQKAMAASQPNTSNGPQKVTRQGSFTQVSTLQRRGSVTSSRENGIAAAAANAAKLASGGGGGGKKGKGGVIGMLTNMKGDLQQTISASSSLFTPPQELIFESEPPKPEPTVVSKVTPKGMKAGSSNSSVATTVVTAAVVDTASTAESGYSFDHPLEVAGLTDLKTIELGHKYSFLSKLHIFTDRLKKAVNNTRKKSNAVASNSSSIRKESNASTIASSTAGATVDSANTIPSLPYIADIHQLHSRTNEAQIRDMHAVQGDLIGHEVFHLLLGETLEEVNAAAEAAAGSNLHEMASIAEKSETKSTRINNKRRESNGSQGSRGGHSRVSQGGHSHSSHAGSSYGDYGEGDTSDDDDNSSVMSANTTQTAIYPYQLMVIDVYVGLPKPNAAAAIAAGGMASLSRQGGKNGPNSPSAKLFGPGTPKHGNFTSGSGSVDGTTTPTASKGDGMSRSSDRNDQNSSVASGLGGRRPVSQSASGSGMNLSDFVVDMHQIVGLFSCNNERSPPNLDCGLLNWDYFTQIYRERTQTTPHKLGVPVPSSSLMGNASLAGGINSSSASLASGGNAKERMWSPVNPVTGVSVHKTLLPTGREFQFHMLAAAPNREHLDRELPKKVKIYLGMPVVSTK